MEFEEIVKRLEWFDTQQRQSKEMLASLNERLTSFETTVNVLSKQAKAIDNQLTNIGPAAKRLEQYEALLSKQRTDIVKLIEDNEKTRLRNKSETAKKTKQQVD